LVDFVKKHAHVEPVGYRNDAPPSVSLLGRAWRGLCKIHPISTSTIISHVQQQMEARTEQLQHEPLRRWTESAYDGI